MNSFAYTACELGIDLAKSEKTLRKVVSAEPDNAAYLDSLAYACYRRGLYAEAQNYIEDALRKIDLETPASVILEHAGDIARASQAFQIALAQPVKGIHTSTTGGAVKPLHGFLEVAPFAAATYQLFGQMQAGVNITRGSADSQLVHHGYIRIPFC
jgi:tetratricopeptide (TPR) repeat protein